MAGYLVKVLPASASVKEVFIRVGYERRALKIIYKDGEQYSDTDELDLIREVNVLHGFKQPCIAEVMEVVETVENISIFMEAVFLGKSDKTTTLATWLSVMQ